MTAPLGLVITVRDKARYIERAALASMNQICRPIDIVLSDQGSTDGTREILDRLAAEYEGPHRIVRLNCPETEFKGMEGLNRHIKWVTENTDCAAFSLQSGDDYALPGFAATLLNLLDEHPEASMVTVAMSFRHSTDIEEGINLSSVTAYTVEGWVSIDACLHGRLGGSTQLAIRREFWNRIGPIPGICGPDLYLPVIGAAYGALWYQYTPLYVHIFYKDLHNMGLEGIMAALETQQEKEQLLELMQWQIGSSWMHAMRKLQALGEVSQQSIVEIGQEAYNMFGAWADQRLKLTLERIPPIAFAV